MLRIRWKQVGLALCTATLCASMLAPASATGFDAPTADAEWCNGIDSGNAPPRESLHDMRSRIAAQFTNAEFPRLLRTATTILEHGCQTEEGELLSGYLLSGFSEAFRNARDWDLAYVRIQGLRQEYPDHPLPYLAESRY